MKRLQSIARLSKLMLLLVLLVPSFTSYFMDTIPDTVLSGISLWQLLYFLLVLLGVRVLAGEAVMLFAISTVSCLALPVVFVGAAVYCLKALLLGEFSVTPEKSEHYVSLLLNMLAVIPVAIAFMSQIPLRQYERYVFQRKRSVSLREKSLLMATRVINHILFTVIPSVLQVWREEHRKGRSVSMDEVAEDVFLEDARKIKQRIIRSIGRMLDIGIACICFSVEYIPLWALEIGDLPSDQVSKENTYGA